MLRGSLDLSVRPMKHDPTAPQLFEPPSGYLENSIDTHRSILEEVRENGHSTLLRAMPRTVGKILIRMGRQLKDDEHIYIFDSSGNEHYVDRTIRDQMESSLTYEQHMRDLVAGRIIRIEADLSRITMVLTTDARPVNAEINYADEVPLDTIKSAITPSRDEGPIVVARGTFRYMDSSLDIASSQIEELKIVDDVDSRRMEDFIHELESISLLDDGWYGEESLAPSVTAVMGARALTASLLFYDVPFPHAFPREDGGVSLEWSLESVEASVTFHTSSERATVASWDAITAEHRYTENVLVTGDFLRGWIDSFESPSRV